VNIALVADQRFFLGLWGTAMSLLATTVRADDLTLYVVDCGLEDASWQKFATAVNSHPYPPRLVRMSFPLGLLKGLYLPDGKKESAYARLFFPDLFDFSTLLYLDSDLLIFRDIHELARVDLADKAGAAVINEDGDTLDFDIDPQACLQLGLDGKSNYFNTGLFEMNLQYWRDNDLTKACLDYLAHSQPRYVDQTAINAVMNEHIVELDRDWNRLVNRISPSGLVNPNCVVHYTNDKPWLVKQRTPAGVLFEQFCCDTGLEWTEPPESKTIWDRYEFLNLPRGIAYRLLAEVQSLRGNHDRSVAYAHAGQYWLEWFANRKARHTECATAERQIRANCYTPDWLT
jgi:lipopolysaccharide biosynthesis glycosyltransferase